MSDAQLGLLTATPIIIAFAGTLRAMGVLSTTATVAAVGLSIAIAVVLFTTQQSRSLGIDPAKNDRIDIAAPT